MQFWTLRGMTAKHMQPAADKTVIVFISHDNHCYMIVAAFKKSSV